MSEVKREFRHCTRCGSINVSMMVQATIVAPASLEHQFSKRNLRQKDVYFMGVSWENADFICKDCGHVDERFGNYMKQLKRENDRLKELVKKYESDE